KSQDDLSDKEFLDMFHIYIIYVTCENKPLKQKKTWFLTTQAALLAIGSYLLQKYVEVFHGHLDMERIEQIILMLLYGIMVWSIGLLTSFLAWRSIRAASKAQNSLKDRWEALFLNRSDALGLPRLLGGGDEAAGKDGSHFARWLPPVMFAAWVAFVLVVPVVIWLAPFLIRLYLHAPSPLAGIGG